MVVILSKGEHDDDDDDDDDGEYVDGDVHMKVMTTSVSLSLITCALTIISMFVFLLQR